MGVQSGDDGGVARVVRLLVGWAMVLIFVTAMLVMTGAAGVLIMEGPDGLQERTERVTGSERVAETVGDLFGDELDRQGGDAAPAEPTTGHWPDHPQDDREFSALRVERIIAAEINEIRAEHNLSELTVRADVVNVSRDHSQDMYEREYFAHETPDGQSPQDRIDAAGVDCAVGENLGQMWYEPALPDGYVAQGLTSEEEVAEAFVEGWMDSPGHRENILTEEYGTHGVGVYVGEDGAVFATHKFCIG